MTTRHKINPAVVAQSTAALVVAITCTDAIRDCISALKPHSHRDIALLRLAAAIIMIIVVIIFIDQFSVCEDAAIPDRLVIQRYP